MNCPNCGKPNEASYHYCIYCGTILPAASTPSAPFANQQREQGRGTLILILGILSIVLAGPVLGIPAWVMGRGDLKKIAAGIIDPSERSLTHTGMVLGIIGTFYIGLIILLGIAIAVIISMAAASGSGFHV